jgi:hypothetical protein
MMVGPSADHFSDDKQQLCFAPAAEMVEDRLFPQGASHRAESRRNPAWQDVSAPDVFSAQVGAAALYQVTVIHRFEKQLRSNRLETVSRSFV